MMRVSATVRRRRNPQRGVSLYLVAAGLVGLLGIAALAIDLASLYVARNEAQRAADAGALAGAKAFVDAGCVSGSTGACSSFQTLAQNAAVAAAGQNSVGGVAVSGLNSSCVSVTFPASSTTNPLVSVTVARTSGCGNPMPTFFAKIWNLASADVSATATAEAYNPSGSSGGPTICAGCLKPFLVPNCDPSHVVSRRDPNANTNCPGLQPNTFFSYFVNPSGPGAIVNPGPVSSGGVIGAIWPLHTNPGPSQYYEVDTGCGDGDQRPCISSCTSGTWACGHTLTTVQGNKVGQITQGIDALIHDNGIEGSPGPNPPQDTIDTTKPLPFPITGGTANPYGLAGKVISSSDSLVTVAIYDGSSLAPGHQTVTITGYMQLFIQYVDGSATITAVILGVTGCGTRTGTCGSSSTLSGGGGTLFPIRLVRNPGT